MSILSHHDEFLDLYKHAKCEKCEPSKPAEEIDILGFVYTNKPNESEVKRMTNKEVIEWLKAIKVTHIHGGDEEYDKLRKEAIDTAIKAVEFINENFPKTFIEYLNGEQI